MLKNHIDIKFLKNICRKRHLYLHFTNFCEVDKGALLGSDPDDLRRSHNKSLLLSRYHVRILRPHDVKHPRQ